MESDELHGERCDAAHHKRRRSVEPHRRTARLGPRMMTDATPFLVQFWRKCLLHLTAIPRRWQFVEILRPGVHNHLEHAGAMQDGTPLIAVFVCDPVTSEHAAGIPPFASSRGAPTVHAR